MGLGRRTFIVIVLVVPVPLAAQSRTGFAVTPFVGLVKPGKDLLLRPGLMAGRDQEKQATMAVLGGRISLGLTTRFELEADIASGKSGLNTTSISAPSGTDARMLVYSGRLVFRFEEPLAPLWGTVSAGAAGVQRSFSSRASGQPTAVSDKTSVGGVIGGLIGFHISSRTALTIGVDAFIYNASFDVAATGSQPAGTTQSLTQRDLRFSVGLRVPIVGR